MTMTGTHTEDSSALGVAQEAANTEVFDSPTYRAWCTHHGYDPDSADAQRNYELYRRDPGLFVKTVRTPRDRGGDADEPMVRMRTERERILDQLRGIRENDTRRAVEHPHGPVDLVLPGLPLGKLGFCSAWGKTGKGFWALAACHQVGAGGFADFGVGVRLFGHPTNDGETRPAAWPGHNAVYVSWEENEEDLDRRVEAFHRYWREHGDDPQLLDDLHDCVHIYGIAGKPNTKLFDRNAEILPAFEWIEELIERHRARLVILDPLSHMSSVEENDNGRCADVIQHLTGLAQRQDTAVIVNTHESKAAQGNPDIGDAAIRGASALSQNARYVLRLRVMTRAEADGRGLDEDTGERKMWVRVEPEKTSYTAPVPGAWLHREQGGILVAAEPPDYGGESSGKRGRGRATY